MEEEFDFETISKILNQVSTTYSDSQQFIAAIYEDDKVEIRFSDLSGIDTSLFNTGTYTTASNQDITIEVSYVTGPEIVPFIGDIKEHPPLQVVDSVVLGGDPVRNTVAIDYYGTISFFTTQMDISVKTTSGTKKCSTANALVSNNHVIARSDKGKKGEKIWVPTNPQIAALHCFIPLKSDPDVDVATAGTYDMSTVETWKLRDIGKLADIKLPKKGTAIRKYGARTGLTSGKVLGMANIQIKGIMYNGVFVTSGGFGCPGDSGSTVVNSANDLLGIYSWGENIDCSKKPKGYFYSFITPKSFRPEGEEVEIKVAR